MRRLAILSALFILPIAQTGAQEAVGSLPTSVTPPATQSAAPSRSSGAAQPPALPRVENLLKFNPGTLELNWHDGHWLLAAGDTILKDFGRKEADGQSALRLIRMLDLNQRGTVGAPAPSMEYWLTDGTAPRGAVPGYTTIHFDSTTVHVEETAGQWCVRDSKHVLFNFGPNSSDARQVLAVLRKYSFDRAVVIGQPVPSMLVFLGNPYAEAANSAHGPHPAANHDSPETAARKADELKRLQEQVPGIDAGTVAQPALRPLREPNQPRQPFSSNMPEYGEGLNTTKRPLTGNNQDERVAFDWRQLQIRLESNSWQIAAGSLVLASFGPDQDAARRALDAIRYYRFTERHFVGAPERVFSYFLVNGVAPRGVPFGVPGEMFQPDALKVRQVDAHWSLCMGDRPVIVLGQRQEEANDLLATIKRQHFDMFCRIGRPEDGFTFLTRTR